MADQDTRAIALIADDDPTMRLMMEKVVEQLGLVAAVAADGDEAMTLLAGLSPALVLLDVEMPGVTGYEVCRRVRQTDGGHHVPVIMVTAHDDIASVDQAYEAGATDFIAKPINWPVFGHRLKYILRNAGTVQALDASEAANKALLHAIPDRLYLVDGSGAVRRALHADAEPIDHIRAALPANVVDHALACIGNVLTNRRTQTHEYEIKAKDGQTSHFETRYVLQSNDRVLTIIRDISERKLAEQRIRQLANYDTLTGLPNRALFEERAAAVIADTAATDETVAVLYVDLDRFSRINDSLGHTVGDTVLKSVALRVSRLVYGGSDGVGRRELARFGGDEFVIFVRHADAREQATTLAGDIIDALSRPFTHEGHEFVVTPSVGISLSGHHGDDVEALIKNADTAVYSAKSDGRNKFRIYADTMNTRSLQRLSLELALRRAIDAGELTLNYQPKYRAEDLNIAGAEALVRWHSKDHGAVSPEVFVPMAEELGLIEELGQFVLESACRDLAALDRSGKSPIAIAVNMSGREFLFGDPATRLQDAVTRFGIPPRRIEVELTESVLMHDIDRVERCLNSIRELGFRLSVDDFGTGFSSLGYLKRFPIHALKIDRSFVQDIPDNGEDVAICEAILALARSLGLHVVAEGVETDEQLAWLRNNGCELLQGFLLSKPLPFDAFTALLDGPGAVPQPVSATR